jgi:glycosyltransferase involved in cell wall biosynthesis
MAMSTDERRLAVVPAYNEAATVGSVVGALHRDAPEWDVLVVDDGSTDDTARIAAAAGARVVSLPFNLGIGGAVQSGYRFALENDYDIAVQVDGDGQHDVRHLAEFVEFLRHNPHIDMVTGSRFLERTKDGYRSSASRRVGIRIFSSVLSAITRRRVTDPTSGFRMTTRRGITLFANDYPHDYPEVEAVLMVHAHRLESAELPVRMKPRSGGVSSIGSTQSVYYMVKVLLALFVGLFRTRPVPEPGQPAPVSAEHAI